MIINSRLILALTLACVLLVGCDIPFSSKTDSDSGPIDNPPLAQARMAAGHWGSFSEDERKGVVPPLAEMNLPVAPLVKKSKLHRRSKPKSLPGENWSQKVALDFRNAEVGDILRTIAELYNVNIMAADTLDKRITIKLRDVALDEAFATILQLSGYRYAVKDNIVLVRGQDSTLVTRIIDLNMAEPKDVEPVLSSYMKAANLDGDISIVENPNRVILVASSDTIVRLEKMVHRLDQRPRQVIIRASIIVVDANSFFNLGVSWGAPGEESQSGMTLGTDAEGNSVSSPQNLLTFPSAVAKNFARHPIQILTGNFGFPGPSSELDGGQITLGTVIDQLALDAKIDAMVSRGKAKILSQPRIGVISNHTAKIIVGQEALFSLETTATGSGNTVQSNQFREAGVTLEVTPIVGDDGFVTIKLKPEVSSFTVDPATNDSPPINTTRAETVVCIKDRHTAVIGGLVTRTDAETSSGAPGLRKMPVVRHLFGGRSNTWTQQEVIVLITPTIVSSGDKWPTRGSRLENPMNVPWKKNPEHIQP